MNQWSSLSERERYLVIGGVGLLLICIIYFSIFAPLFHAVATKKQELITKRATLEWMAHLPKGMALQSNIVSKKSMLTNISQQLAPFKATPYQLQQLNSNDIQLSFESVSYAKFMPWLWKLTNNYQLTIKQFNVERTETTGMVKLQIVFV
jgi:general secretion pathway protein M